MSADKKTTVVQAEIKTPSLDDVNPLKSNDPLVQTVLQGEVPSNALLNDAIDRAKLNIEVSKEEADLNYRGEQLAKDATAILDTAQRFINEKNRDDKIQELVKHSKEASMDVSKEASKASNSISNVLVKTYHELRGDVPTEQVKSDANAAYNYARELVLFALRSREFRQTVLDFINFFQSSLNEATSKINRIGDSLKNDVNRADANLNSTSKTVERTTDETKQALENKQAEWSEEKQQQYYQRFRQLLNRISDKPEYKRLLGLYWKWMDDLKERADDWTETLKNKADEAKNQVQKSADKLARSSAFDKMWNDVRGIIDSFGGQGSFDSFYSQSWDLYYQLLNDPEANAWFRKFKNFVNDAVNDPASLNSDLKMKEGNVLLQEGRKIINSDRYVYQFNRFLDSWTSLMNNISNDTLTNELTEKIRLFGEHFALDSQGRPDLNVIQDSLVQIKNLVHPLVSDKLSSVSIARIAGSNETYDWSIENLLVSVPDLIPETFELRTKNFLQVNVKDLETAKNNTKVVMEIKNIKPVFRDMKFWYKRKTFPHIEDFGTADIDLSKGNGAKIKVIWKIKSNNNRPFAFSLIEVKCVIDSMDVRVKDAKHEFLDRIATSLFSASIKQSVAGGIVNSLVDAVQPLNDQMNNWFASRPLTSLYDRANEGLHYAYDRTNLFIKDQPVQKTLDKAKETVNYLKDAASETLESAKEVVQEKASDLKEYVEQKTTDVKEYVEEKKEQVQEKVEEVKSEVQQDSSEWTNVWQKSSKKKKHHQKKKHAKGPYDLDNDFPTLNNVSAK